MAIILYAITRDGYFCRKESDNKTDNLEWMRVSTDRQLFRELTTLFGEQTILVGGTTASVLPKLPNRNMIVLSRNPTTGMDLTDALIKYPNAILIGGGTVIKHAMAQNNIKYINSIITVRLPISIPETNTAEYEPDPLVVMKTSGVINKSSDFFIHTAKTPSPEIIMEIWRTTKTKN